MANLIPMGWFVAAHQWAITNSGFWYSVFFPNSLAAFWLPVALIAVAWWCVIPKPRFSAINLTVLCVALPAGLFLGIFLGLAFTCAHMNKCM